MNRGKNYPFEPKTKEVAELGDWFSDDDVDVEGRHESGVQLKSGETCTWDYVYKNGGEEGYEVQSGDAADIELLRLTGTGQGSKLDVTLTFNFSDGTKKSWNWKKKWGAHYWVMIGDDLLGVLQDKIISGFQIKVLCVSGAVKIDTMSLYWEVWDIEGADNSERKPSKVEARETLAASA